VPGRRPQNLKLTRRGFLAKTGALGALIVAASPPGQWLCLGASKVSISEAFDHAIDQFMSARKTPGRRARRLCSHLIARGDLIRHLNF